MLDIHCGALVKFKGTDSKGKVIEGTGTVYNARDVEICTVLMDTLKIDGVDVSDTIDPDYDYSVPVKHIFDCKRVKY